MPDQHEGAPPLYRASVPVFLAILDRIAAELRRAEEALGENYAAALERRPADRMFPAAQQAASSVQFMLRTAFPLVGLRPPEIRGELDGPGLMARIDEARRLLAGLDPAAFAGAETRIARGQAGFATVELPGEAFLFEFGLPNIYFHQAMAHVALKQAGAPLGKVDYDGRHDYPAGFSLG
ncbi:DUF1993 family protein [Amaricoccus sp.]|uniref:DUF1993 family protein n=1 Tax=Amaricoccus sp. TaxID=1872485 RepID=UPI001B4586E7|nr:DUF1993 family protein [Amaricoccus sp.]MBP7242697.1 DUF1993 family protein [Amaricoccus sp.]